MRRQGTPVPEEKVESAQPVEPVVTPEPEVAPESEPVVEQEVVKPVSRSRRKKTEE
jgi:hypothetical protein